MDEFYYCLDIAKNSENDEDCKKNSVKVMNSIKLVIFNNKYSDS